MRDSSRRDWAQAALLASAPASALDLLTPMSAEERRRLVADFPQQVDRRRRRRREEGDDVGAVVIGLEARERHLVSGNNLLRIDQVGVQRVRVPNNIRLFHRRRIIVGRLRSGLAADDAGQRWTEDRLARFHGMTRLAFSEHEPPRGRIAARSRRRTCGRRCRRARLRVGGRHNVGHAVIVRRRRRRFGRRLSSIRGCGGRGWWTSWLSDCRRSGCCRGRGRRRLHGRFGRRRFSVLRYGGRRLMASSDATREKNLRRSGIEQCPRCTILAPLRGLSAPLIAPRLAKSFARAASNTRKNARNGTTDARNNVLWMHVRR